MRTLFGGALCALLCSLFILIPAVQSQENSPAKAEAEKLAQLAREASETQSHEVQPPAQAPAPEPTATPVPQPTAAPTDKPEKKSPLNLNQADLNTVVKYISGKTNKPVIFGAGITPELIEKKKITIINPAEQTDQENLALLYRVLSHQDIAVVDEDDILVVQVLEGKRRPNIPITEDFPEDKNLEVPITQARELENVRGGRILDSLKGMVRNPEALQYDRQTNTLFYTDTKSYVAKFLFLVDLLDKDPREGLLPRVKQITNVSAEELVQPALNFLDQYARSLGRDNSRTLVKPEPLTNSLIIRGPTNEVEALSQVITQLDKATWRSIERITKTRAINRANPDEIIQKAKDYLASFVAIHGDPGDIPLTVFNYDPVKRELVMRGPQAELDALAPLLDRWDPSLTERTRKFDNPDTREKIIADSLKILVEEYKKDGWADYEHHITWEANRFDPTEVIFNGPADELDRLMNILNKVDEPREERVRSFNNFAPQEVIPQALDFMVQQRREEGDRGFEHSVTWKRSELDPGQVIIEGPKDELDSLFPILEKLDPSVTTRTRTIQYATPEEVIPVALNMLVEDYEEQGRIGYRTKTTWERERFDPNVLVFKGPAQELNDLFKILDNLDKPLVKETRVFYTKSPEEVFPEAEKVLVQQYEREGYKNFEPTIFWKRSLLDSSQIEISAPQEQMNRLMAILNTLDPPSTTRTRTIQYATPEEVIPVALNMLVEDYEEQGRIGYRTKTTWERERFDPNVLVFKGPAQEINDLFAILDQLDKPLVKQTRTFYSKTPQEAISEAKDLLVKQYEREGYEDFAPTVFWERDLLDPTKIVISAPQEQMTRLTSILNKVDPPTTMRTRSIVNATPEEVIPSALDIVRQEQVEEGYTDYETRTTWERDRWDPSIIRFEGPPEELSNLFSVLDKLDKPRVTQTRTFYSMEPGEAIPAAMDHLRRQYAEEGRPDYEFSIEWDRDPLQPSQIRIKGPSDEVSRLVAILDQIDKPMQVVKKQIVNEDPQSLIEPALSLLKQHYVENNQPEYEPQAEIRFDKLTGELVLRAPSEELSVLQTILADLDRAQWQDQTITTQKFALGVAPAEDLIQAASDYLAQQVELQGEYGDKPGVVFKVDPITNSIILYGPSTQIAMCMEVMTAMEANSKRGLKPVVIYPKHVSPTQLSSELSSFVSTNIEPSLAPTLQVNDRLGAIFITGTDDVVAKVRDWIRLFDVPKGQNQTQRVVKLKNAEASTLYSVLSQLQILSPDGRMVPETQSNSLLIVDTTETIDRLMPFIEELDVVPPFDNMVYQVIKTRTAQAGYLQTALNQYAQQLASQKGRATRNRATVSYEPYSGSVIVFGLKSDVEQIAKVAAEFDKIELENKKPEFIYLEHADANQTSSTLSRLLSNISPTQSPSLVLPEPRINALIVVAEGEVLEQVKEMIAKIDVDSEETQEFRVIPIENVNASQIYSVVYQALMNSYTGSQAPYVTYEPYSNSLIVRAHPDDFETVDKLVEQLDVVSDRQQEVRLVKLKYASAPQVYGVISSLLSALSGGTTAPYVTYLDNSTLVIRAQKDQFSKIDEVVAEFDLPKTAEQEFRVLEVKNISAGAAYNAIYYMLMSDYTGNTQPYVTYSSNQVFVRAHKDDFPKVEELLAEIDMPATQNHEFRAFQVKNIPASQAYSVVYAMLSNDFTGSTGPYVTYAGNQVLVRAHKDDLPKVEKILSEIDVPATQDHEFRAFQVKHIPASQAYSVVYSMLMNDYTGSAAPYMTYGGNQVLVRAHKDDLAKAEKILSEIDISDTENYEFKVIPIKYAVPSQAYYAVYYMLQSDYTGSVAPYVNYTGKNLYVRAHKDDFAKVDKLLSEIDISGMENQEIRVIKIENAPVYPIYLAVSTLLTGSYTGIQEPYVTYDTANNNLIVRAHKDDYPRIQEIVDRLDVSPEADYELKVIPVKGMNAGTLVGNLRPMMIGQNVLFFPDTASNSIIANGRPQDIEKVEEIVDRLGQTGEDATIKLVPLENANYGTLSAALNQYMQVRYGQQPTRPGTYPDSTANAIYIYGASEEVASIEKIVHDLDIPTDSKQEVRIFPIKQAQAATVYTALRSLLFTDYTGGVQPFVTYDNTTNVVIVSAHPEDMVKAEKFIEQIDSTKLDRLEVRMVEVENTPANSIVSALSYLSTSRGRVTADNQTNTVVIVDTPETVEYLASVVKELDVDRKDQEMVTEVRNLRYADANYLSNSVINQIAREKMTKSGTRNPEVSAFAEPNSNSLILVGASDEVKYYLGLVDQFDSATTAGGEIVLFQLKHTQARNLANQFDRLFRNQNRARTGIQTSIISDDDTNSIIAIGSETDIQRLRDLIEKLDVPDAGGQEIRVFPLEGLDATTLSNYLRRMLGPNGEAFADAGTNSLVVYDSTEILDRIEKIVNQLAERGVNQVLEFRKLDYADADYLATNVINQIAQEKMRGSGRRTPEVTAFSEPTSNSLIILGASEELDYYLKLVEEFDNPSAAGGEVRLFQLKYTEANSLANQFDRLFRNQSRGRAGVQTSVIADPETNSLIAVGSELDLKRLEDLISKLDVPDAGGLEVRVFTLEGVSASNLSNYLQRMVSPKGQVFPDQMTNSLVVYDTPEFLDRVEKIINQLSEKEFEDAFEIRKLSHAEASTLIAPINNYLQLRASRSGMSSPSVGIYPETSSNSVLIFGPTNEIKAITNLIDQLDIEGVLDREPVVFELKYIDAQRISRELEALLRRARPSGAQRPAIVAEQNSNTLVVVAENSEIEMIRDILKKMDVPEAGGLETVVIPLNNASAQELATNLKPPMVSTRSLIFADTLSNSLVVTDTHEGILKIRELLATLDGDDRQMVYEVRPLENTTYTSIQTQLDQFLQHEARIKNLRQPMTQIMGDADANSVVIYGPTEEVDLLMGLIDRLDAESLYDRAPRIFFLEKAQAQEVATLLQQILLSGRGRRSADAPRIQAYPETNSIVVIASEPDIKRVEGLIADLDKGKQTGIETRVFPLKNANPQDLLQVLSPLVGQPAKLSADTQARIIIYTDTPANLDELQSLIDQLDEISSEGELVTHVQALKNTDSSTVSNVLSQYSAQLAQRKGRRTPLTQVFPDPVSNSVTVVGPTDEVSLMKDLIGELDAESLREREIEIYYLERASATDAAREINQLMAQLSRGPNAPRVGTNLESNALVVVATPADLIIIERIIEGIDSDLAGLRRTEVIPLEHADAQTLYQTLSQMAGPGGTLTVHADSNSVVYTDTEANIQKMKKIIEDLDAESQMDNVVQKVVTLKNTNATSITTPLQNIISQVSGFQAKGSKPPTQVYPEVEANAVVIVGASEDVSQLSRIVSELDSEAMYNREPVIVFLERARARDVAQELQQLFTLQRSNRTPPRIVANEWANALMVVADPQDAEMIEKIAVQLDTSEGNKRVVEIFVLENSDASALAEKLRALFQEGGRTTGNNRRSYYGYYGYSSGRRSEGLTEGEIGVTADLRLNALIVTAEPQDMDQVKELIELLDMESPFSGEPKVYSLKNAEAEAIAETLNDLFSDTDFVRNRYYTESRDVTVSGLSGRVRVMAVPQTNSIIVLASSPSAFETVEELIDELDVPNERAGKTQVIKVDNADVTSLKKTLEDLFKPEEQNNTNRSLFFFDDFFGGNGGAGGDSFSNLIGKVRIQADTRTSSLLVVTPEVYFPAVQHIVETLDVPTKQVMLKVLIAEITRRNQRDLGFQWGVDPDTGEVGQISINNTEIFNFDNDRGDTYSPLTSPIDLITTGGFTDAAQFFTLNQTQFGTVINFLQSCQDVAVKQSPMIIAADNERAYIKVGQRTPFVSDISAVGGQVNSSVEYQDIGLSLEVTPKINSETTVTLSIKLTDGAIDPTIPLLSGVAATFTDREIETSPIVQNRNTVVLGGVIFDRENEIIDEVPFLHRLPVVGDKVFTNRAKNKETVELITFITPYILNDEEDATMATEMVRQKSNDQDLKRIDLKNGDWPVEYVEEGDSGSAWPGR